MLTTFTTARTNFSNGIAGWTPNTAASTRPYRFTWTLGNDNNAQDKTAAEYHVTSDGGVEPDACP